jgi:Zn-dependent protease with chaperone function
MSSIGLFRNNALILVGPEIRTLQTEEIVACAAHEIAHIKHRDAIIRTITFTVFMFLIAYITRVTMQDLLFQVELFCFSLLIGFTLVIASMRAQEFAADATSALLTEHLENLISVLNDREMPASQPSTWATLTSTHPSRKHRIAALQSLILEP